MNQSIKKAQINSSCFSFILFRTKSTIQKLNTRMKFAADIGKNSDSIRVLRARIAIEKTIQST